MAIPTRRTALSGVLGSAAAAAAALCLAQSATAAEAVVMTPMNCGVMISNNLDVDTRVGVLRGDRTVAAASVPAGATVPVDLSGQFDGQPAIEFYGAWDAPSTGLTGGTSTYVVYCEATEPPPEPEPEPEDPKGPPASAGPPPGVGNPNAGPPPHAGQKGRPAHAGQQGPPPHAKAKGRGPRR